MTLNCAHIGSTPPVEPSPSHQNALQLPPVSSDSVTDAGETFAGLKPLNLGYLDLASFPERTPFGQVPPTTFHNIKYLLEQRGVNTRFNVISKKTEIRIPGLISSVENADSSAMTHIMSMVAGAGLSTGRVPELVQAIADERRFNPVATWITSKGWDGIDRLPALYATLTVRPDFPNELKEKVLYHWLLSATAAALKPSGFKTRGVLTLQGPQSLGKSTWLRSLVNQPSLQNSVVLSEHQLDPRDKDSVLTAISHWLVEFSELESTFKKDIGNIKAFVTKESDKIRPPYGRDYNHYPRRTVFCASVNMDQFLVDATGNTRWMTLPLVKIDKEHDIDMQQVFAQLALDFYQGAEWWLSDEDEKWLESFNKKHMTTSAIAERLKDAIDLDRIPTLHDPYMGTVEALKVIGVLSPRNPEMKEAAQALRALYGEPKSIGGNMKWRICWRQRGAHTSHEAYEYVSDDERF